MAVKNKNGTSSPQQLLIASCMIFFIVAVGSVGKIDAQTICTTGKVIEGYCSSLIVICSAECLARGYSYAHSRCLDDDCYCMICPGEGASKMIVTEKLKLKRSCTMAEIIEGVCFP